MHLALYDEHLGYYRKNKTRIGYGRGTDFFTASTSGSLFGELVACAVTKLIGPTMAAESTFVEIGAESSGGVMIDVAHSFKAVRTVQLGDDMELTGKCVVFSNELFDAQPCRRFIYRESQWKELGVACTAGELHEVELSLSEPPQYLPEKSPEGYVLDAPRAAVDLLENIASQPWDGLFVAFDYGKCWPELNSETPQGTVRAYFQHTQSNDLLANPGEQDLTCHICWDWLSRSLSQYHFVEPTLESQEAFLIHHAASLLADISVSEAAHLSDRKLALMQLIHPAHLGQKFQVLHAYRVAE